MVPPTRLADGTEVITPVVPVLVGDDWKAVFLWKALYDAGVFVNVMIHPAVPPAGALLRTSVMATHDRETLDRALEMFVGRQAGVRVRAWDAARAADEPSPSCPFPHKTLDVDKKGALSACHCAVTLL